MKIRIYGLIIAVLSYHAFALAAELSDYRKAECVVHIHTDISTGTRPLESYINEAREKGIGVIVLSDTYCQRWEYGLPPFRRLVKKVVQQKSVMTFGMDNYLNMIKKMNGRYADMVVIDGVQVNPFYYWSGSFLNGTMTLNNRNKDMLVIGLGNADDYGNMPLVSNHKSRFDAYHGDKFTRPHQELIDYVIKKDGLIFWSHPECEENAVIEGINLNTAPYQWDLAGTYDYTGFGIFWTGYKKTGNPAGIWDRILTEYCEGRRRAPVWAIGELEEEGLGDRNLDDIMNVIYVKDMDRRGVLDALKAGRLYVTFKVSDWALLTLDEFTVSDETGRRRAVMGEEVSSPQDPIIRIKISHKTPAGADKEVSIKLIRNNKIIKEFKDVSNIEIEYKDEGLPANQRYYYRIDAVSSSGSRLVSNPIFFIKR